MNPIGLFPMGFFVRYIIMKVSQLVPEDYNPYYKTYIDALGGVTLNDALKNGLEEIKKLLSTIPDDKLSFRYADGKWTIAEVLLHIIDTERVFQYRALCFSRNDKALFPGFDQDAYVENSNAAKRTKESILQEFIAVRASTIALFQSFDENDLQKRGVASNSTMSVAAAGFIISGHLKHHQKILVERYLI